MTLQFRAARIGSPLIDYDEPGIASTQHSAHDLVAPLKAIGFALVSHA
jgi:hypothetical protein